MASSSFSSSIPSQNDMHEMITSAREFFEDMNDGLDDITLWNNLTSKYADRSSEEIAEYCSAFIEEYKVAILGSVPGIDRRQNSLPIIAPDASTRDLIATLREGLPDQGTTKGLVWSTEEHRLFLLGMKCCGKGDWKNISRYFVLSRTPTQIASHAQKYFSRGTKQRGGRRSSTHDIDTVADQVQPPPNYSQNGSYEWSGSFNVGQPTSMPMPTNIYQSSTPPTASQHFWA